MLVSVIVCTFNRASLLKRLLDSLVSQSIPQNDYEIIVVVDGSTDITKDICNEASRNLKNLRTIIINQQKGFSTAANQGLNASSGEFVLFTDDDCIPDLDWIERMKYALQCHSIVVGKIESPKKNYLILSANISEFHPFMGQQKAREVDFIAGANMGFRREVIEKIGGFLEGNLTPDMEIVLRARQKGYKIYYVPESHVYHVPSRGGLINILKHASSYSSSTIQLRNKYRSILHTPYFLTDPWWLLILSPAIAAGKTIQIYISDRGLMKSIHTAPLVFLLKISWCIGAYQGLRTMQRQIDTIKHNQT